MIKAIKLILICFRHFLLFFFPRVAGTVGAIVTCPLEVVKTRLQSSSAFLPPRFSNNGSSNGNNRLDAARLHGEHRNKFCSTILKRRPQVRDGDDVTHFDDF